MRKLILTMISSALFLGVFGQSSVVSSSSSQMKERIRNNPSIQAIPTQLIPVTDNGIPYSNAAEVFTPAAKFRASDIIGVTGYDLQTNSGAFNRIIAYPDGTRSAIWTGSDVADGAWADRGMYYRYYDGSTWGAEPEARLENVRTGFGEIIIVEDHEVVVSHDGSFAIRLFKNSAKGMTDWVECGGSGAPTGLWPRMYCPVGTDDLYIIQGNANPPTALYFSKSTDGGETWDILNEAILDPLVDTEIAFITADAYQIAVYGPYVGVIYGSSGTDIVLISSLLSGASGTWTKTVLLDSPINWIPGESGTTTDYDSDGDFDTLETCDGTIELLLTDDGTVHVWASYLSFFDDDTASGYSYFPDVEAFWYWNSTILGPASAYLAEIDWNNEDGADDPYAGIGGNNDMYQGATNITHLTGSIDETSGRIYLIYAMKIEYTDYEGDPSSETAQSFRDLFGTFSDDDGATWSEPINLTYTAHLNEENVMSFSAEKVIDGIVNVVWQQDNDPGTSLDTNTPDAFAFNNIRHAAWDETRFMPYDPLADFTFFVTTDGSGEVEFTNSSIDAEDYVWNFGDGGSSGSTNPTYSFSESSTFTVCLTAKNHYGENIACKDVTVAVSIEDVLLNKSLEIFPSPSNGNVNVVINSDNFQSATVEVFNMLGESVMNAITMNVSANSTMNLDLTFVAEGNYVVKVLGDNGGIAVRQLTIAH
ncbi:MAG: PKD domain-containing protein [Chitinophagales bacterium]|nr:PKD domain-containing protein [Chitinophagales bacterium]